jgi:hypothetical protein
LTLSGKNIPHKLSKIKLVGYIPHNSRKMKNVGYIEVIGASALAKKPAPRGEGAGCVSLIGSRA